MRVKSGGSMQYRHVFHAGYIIAKEYGLRGVYQGFSGTLLRNIPNNAIGFGTNNLFEPIHCECSFNNKELITYVPSIFSLHGLSFLK